LSDSRHFSRFSLHQFEEVSSCAGLTDSAKSQPQRHRARQGNPDTVDAWTERKLSEATLVRIVEEVFGAIIT
jgi:hypothetical protein